MMDYNNYYPAQPGQPPPGPPQTMLNNQHDCNMMGGQMMQTNGPNMMHPSPAPSTPQSMRHTPGPPPMQQHMGHTMPQQQPSPHPNYHPLPQHPPISHSASPHPSSTPHSHTSQPPPRPSTGPSPLHHQSPIHMNGPSPKIHPHGMMPNQSQASNQMPPASMQHPPNMPISNHSQLMPPQNHNFSGSPMSQHTNPHYGHPQMNHQLPPPVTHGPPMSSGPALPPPPPPAYLPPSHPMHASNQERGSPFYQHIPQTEFKIIELNKRLQSRPRIRGPSSPLPIIAMSEESDWWERFTCDFFDDDSTLTLRIPSEDKPLEYTIGRTLIPRFFRSYFEGGATDLSIKLRNIRETVHHSGLLTLDCDQADIVTKNYSRQHTPNIPAYVVVHTEGFLGLEFISNSYDNLVIKSWKFFASQCHEYIDRSMTTTGLPHSLLVEPVTRFGLTKSTLAYLKMCMIMEPMQDLMAHHRLTKLDPRSCLKQILHDRYKVKNPDDNRAQPSKRRKRKTAATTGTAAGPTSKKSKANLVNGANAMASNMGLNNNPMSTGDMLPNLSLASQDVLVVGEPSMLGADFGDENERQITRLENNQYDSSVELNSQQDLQIENNQMLQDPNQINNNLNQDQNHIPNHVSQTSNHDASGDNVQSLLSYPNTSHNNGNDFNAVNNNVLNDSNSDIQNNNSANNCTQGSTNTSPHETNHQSISYPVNGESNHIIKSEMDLPKNMPAQTSVAES